MGSLTTSTPPAAASCAYDRLDPRHIEFADVIFTGEIVDDRTVKFDRERRVTFFVRRVYKGEAYREQVVTSRRYTSTTLSIAAGVGEPFVVFARYPAGSAGGPQPLLTADSCGGSREGAAPAELGEGRPPVPGSSTELLRRRTLTYAGIAVAALVASVAALVAGITARRRRSVRAKG